MAEIQNKAFYPAGSIAQGASGYKAAVDSAVLTPNTPVTIINDIGGGVQQVAGVPTWMLALSIVQDWETVTSFSNWIIANAGTIKDFTYTPKTGGKGFTVSCLIVNAPIGAAGGSVAKSQVSFPVVGQPIPVPVA